MNAGKAIQYRYRADWMAIPPEHAEKVDLRNDIRPGLIALGKEIISSITRYLSNGQSFSSDQLTEFMNAIKVNNLSPADKESIFRSLLQVKRYTQLPNR